MSFAYDGLGERVRKVTSASTVYFVYDEAGHLLGGYDGTGNLIQETVWLGDLPLATLRPDGSGGIDVHYVQANHLDTPRRITDDTATIVGRWDSDSFWATPADEDPDSDTNLFSYNLRFPGAVRRDYLSRATLETGRASV